MALVNWRKSSQNLAPARHQAKPNGSYDLYPAFPLEDGQIGLGFHALAQTLRQHPLIVMEGQTAVLWEHLRQALQTAFDSLHISVTWHSSQTALKPEAEINALLAPFLGGNDPIFGTRFTGTLADFFDADKVSQFQPEDTQLNIVYGAGASLVAWDAFVVYVDVPKNEIQFRSRGGSVTCLGASQPQDPKAMYKRMYFVDWVAQRRLIPQILGEIDLFVDEQRPDEVSFVSAKPVRDALTRMSQNYFRARPWFEPGPWGGQWIKKHIPDLAQNVPNYAWSFELISPENGIALRSEDFLLEISFDFLMAHAYREILGSCAERFKYEFPIRFDLLDTYDGGNLSVQCHPRPDYALTHFGETFTQDETYYILDCEDDAHVYLGFREDINPASFKQALETSFHEASPLEIEQFVNVEKARKGDLFLIPHGTIHCSGKNTLVLEISATPYIFTFKMYDWMRLDLDGKPRPLNIDRAFANLIFERKGKQAQNELIAKPYVLERGDSWQIVHLPTHAQHFYDVHRLEFSSHIEQNTAGSFHVLNLVEGASVLLETEKGARQRFSFAETFVIPAAAGAYRLISETGALLKVVKGFMKP